MSVAIWIIAGGAVGWVCCNLLRASGGMGPVFSTIVGALAGFTGGKVIAPMLSAANDAPAEFSVFPVFAAIGVAAGVMALRNFVHVRYDI